MLTTQEHKEMAQLRDKGYSYQRIADTFGVSKQRVLVILNPKAKATHRRNMREYWARRKENS